MLITFIKGIARYLLIYFIGILASLIACANMDIFYIYTRSANDERLAEAKYWVLTGILIGIITGIVFNLWVRALVFNNIRSILSLLAKIVIITISTTSLSAMVWYYVTIDYIKLKDFGPVALTIGFILAMWDLLIRLPHSFTGEKE
jgi:hypothetical protein